MASLEEEYNYILNQGLAIIKKVEPTPVEHQSIQDIHYWYRKAAENLLQRGEPKHKIAGKLTEDFDQFYGERHVRRILKVGGIELPEDKNGQMSENNGSLNSREKVQPENLPYWDMLTNLENAIGVAKKKMEQPYCSLYEDKKSLKQVITVGNGLAKTALEVFDERQLVLTAGQPELLFWAADHALTDAYTHYQLEVKDVMKKLSADSKQRGIRTLETITGKQMNRILSLMVREVHESLDPATPLEARMKGFSGQTCPKCNSLRCGRIPDSTVGRWYVCAACDHSFEGKIIPQYMRGVVMDEQKVT